MGESAKTGSTTSVVESTVSVNEAKWQLSQLLDRAVAGEPIVIARAGRRLVRLVPIVDDHRPRQPGLAKSTDIHISDAFFDPLPEDELAAWSAGE